MTDSGAYNNLEADNFLEIFLQGVPLMDVRAPVEYSAGAFPGAVNLPLLDDEQRHLIGTEYAQQGQAAAIDLGNQLASEHIRAQRLQSWKRFVTSHPEGYLYCFRGGLRSKTTQAWLAEAGINYPLVVGGYKAMRRFLLKQLDRLSRKGNIIVLSGATGVGKTEFIASQMSAIDLEGRAKHRGSAFGGTLVDQPCQIDWENQIIIDWLKCEAKSRGPVLIEAESRLIGRIHLPQALQAAMANAPVLVLEASMQERIQRLYEDYVADSLKHYRQTGVDPYASLQSSILDSLTRIKNRLGGAHFKQLCQILPDAISILEQQDDRSGINRIIQVLLEHYYDDLYRYHLTKNSARVAFRGNMSEISDWFTRNRAPVGPRSQTANSEL